MQSDFLIIGGGLSGLVATWQLQMAGRDVVLLEGRERLGGRALTVGHENDAPCDLGPAWFWEGQPLIASLLSHFKIPYFEQFAAGDVLEQAAEGQVVRVPGPSPMVGARRIDGGIGRLVDAIAEQIDPATRLLRHRAVTLALAADLINVEGIGPQGPFKISSERVALALPPRLITPLNFNPPLPAGVRETLALTPTWMAGHAKFFAVYDEPFWRRDGLCGSALSRSGPLAEIHDASPVSGKPGVLFGFFGQDGPTRVQTGRSNLETLALTQLETLFGERASRPRAVYFHDWNREALTAGPGDEQPQPVQFTYGLGLDLGPWTRRLHLLASETSPASGGLVEGALEAALNFAGRISPRSFPLIDDSLISHTASMGWEWL